MKRTKKKKNLMMKEFKIASTMYVCVYVMDGEWRIWNGGCAEKKRNRMNKNEKRTKIAKKIRQPADSFH